MIVCSCNVLSDHQIRRSTGGRGPCPARLSEVFAELGCKPQCGRCAATIRRIAREGMETPLSNEASRLVAAE